MSTEACSLRFAGTGIGLPSRVMTNEEINRTLNPDIDPEWVTRRLGIDARRICEESETTTDLAARAGEAALARAGLDADDVDLVIVATATPDRQAPSTACMVQNRLGIGGAVAFDISAVCSGFLYGLSTASAFVSAGRIERALVIGADCFSRITDWQRRDCVFFGDGAGAVVIERSDDARALFATELVADGSGQDLFTVPPGCQHFHMDAPGVFDAATYHVPRCIERLLGRFELGADDISFVVPHQPSRSLLQALADITSVPFERFCTNLDRYGNTAAATIPIALHEATERQVFRPGDMILFAAAGAGFTAGAGLYRWH